MTLLSGCFIAPAMKLDEAAAVKRDRDWTSDEDFRVLPITSELVTRMEAEALPSAA